MKLSRRSFISGGVAVTAGFSGLKVFVEKLEGVAVAAPEVSARKYGPLLMDPAKVFDLPKGFSYKVISKTGEKMDDGLLVPGKHDGMAAFQGPDGKTILVRNHEMMSDRLSEGAFGADNALFKHVDKTKLFDAGFGKLPCLGGTSTLVYDTKAQKLEKHFLSLAGTIRNCAGGPTPWGSWLTCEETVLTQSPDREHNHGYVFEVPSSSTGLVDPTPIRGMGRFTHEAVAVDPSSGIVYQTEDRDDGLIYRYVPKTPSKLLEGGKLQALLVRGKKSMDTRNWTAQAAKPGEKLLCDWIDITEVDTDKDDLRLRGFKDGAARFARAEGMWWGNDSVYIACTTGGKEYKGQIWRYWPSKAEGKSDEATDPGVLELFLEPNDGNLIDNCDNLTVAPWGDLYLCEDGTPAQHLVRVTPEGKISQFGRNALNGSELAGACFSPDGTTLFVNIQSPGLTIAITGPWA